MPPCTCNLSHCLHNVFVELKRREISLQTGLLEASSRSIMMGVCIGLAAGENEFGQAPNLAIQLF
jgi:hypothetical protein